MQQLWPDDDFADGATAYGNHPDLYLCHLPINLPSSFEPTTTFQLAFSRGTLFDGHRPAGVDSGWCAPFRDTDSTPSSMIAGSAVWHTCRFVERGEVTVAATPSHRAIGGAGSPDSFRQFGICSHVGGGTLDTTSDESVQTQVGCRGYYLIEAKLFALGHTLFLMESTDGVSWTQLASEEVGLRDVAHTTPAEFKQPGRLRMTVTDNGSGGASISCFRTTEAGTEVALFGGVVDRPTRLADGRCGFGVQTPRTDLAGVQSLGLCELFQVSDHATGDPIFVDEFRRLARVAGQQLLDDTLARGRSLASAWVGDSESEGSAFSSAFSLDRVAGAGAVEIGGPQSDVRVFPGFHALQDPRASPSQVYRLVAQRVNTETAIVSEVGVLLRFGFTVQNVSPGIDGTVEVRARVPNSTPPNQRIDGFKVGYFVAVVHDASEPNPFRLEIRHYDGTQSYSHQAPIIGTAALTTFGLALGTDFNLDVRVENFDGNNFGQGDFVAIRVQVNGGDVIIEPAQISGLAFIGNALLDARSAATSTGGGTGFGVVLAEAGTAPLVRVSSFSRGTLGGGTGLSIPPADMASVPIPSESDGKSGSLTVPLNSEIVVEGDDGPIVHETESGRANVIARATRERRTFSVAARLTGDEWTALLELRTSNGLEIPFDWTVPDTGEAVVVAFKRDTSSSDLRYVDAGLVVHEVRLELEERFSREVLNP